MEYHWSVKDLKRRLKSLKNMYYSSKNEDIKHQLLIDIYDLEDSIEGLTNQEKGCEDAPIEERLELSKEILLPHFYSFEDCIDFNTITSSVDDYQELQKKDITQNDLFSLTHDFYRDAIGGKLFEIFLKQFDIRFNHVRFIPLCEGINGRNIHIRQFDESFITSQNTKTISDLFTLIHEYGHAIHGSINHDQQYNLDFLPFVEIAASFFELIAYDHFISKKFFADEVIKAKFIEWESIINRASDLKPLIQIVQIEDYKNIKHLKRIVQDEYGISKDSFSDLVSSSNTMSYPYVFGAIIAIELLDLYRKDRNLALNYLMQIMNSKAIIGNDLYNEILQLGIIPNSHVEEYESQLKRELKLLH